MASQYFAKGALTVALGLCFVGGAQAQSNTAGAVSGRAVAGDTITIANSANGFSRTITVDEDGGFRLSQLPIGRYVLTRKSVDGATTTRNATVNIGFTANINFVSTGNGTEAIPIDVSSVESTTILTAEQIAKIPVARDTTSVALLAPGTVRGDAAFGNLASFGGASVAENQYYVNGFNITNSFRSLNFSQVPFEAIAEQQIKTGGYGAEFGRSLGGVINQITKRGTNEFHAGGNIFWSPEDLTEETKDVYLTNGTLRQDNSKDTTWNAVASVWASGALIKDRLFAYGLLSYGRTEAETWGNVVASTNASAETKSPTWLLKMDWNIADSHLIELTAFSDKQETETGVYRNDLGQFNRTEFLGTNFVEQGGDNYVLKYTGYLTDNFTLSVLAGRGESERHGYVVQANGVRLDDADWNEDIRRQLRLDGEWQLGEHLLRFGYDHDDYESRVGTLNQHAYYIEDSWNITSNLVAYFGGRLDAFENTDGAGRTFIKINDQFGPRTGFSWDVNGDSTFKVFGTAGRQSMAPPPSVILQFSLTDAAAVASKNLKPMYQDEYTLGFQKQLTGNSTLGMRGIFRNLKSAIEDTCDYTAVLEANGYNPDTGPFPSLPNPGFPYCRIFNPGEDAVFVTDYYGDGHLVENVIPGARLSPKARRTYSAIEFFFDGKWDRLFLQGSYTYAKSKGNIEGGVNSDIGRQDTNVTQGFDYVELTTDTYGYLPNDRRHSLKLFGNYALTEAWSIGTNLLVQSGRQTNCMGVLDLDPSMTRYSPHPYGSIFMRCGVTAQGDAIRRPRGTAGRLPWTTNLDLNVAYQPAWAEGVRFKIDVFNVLDSQKVTSQVEQAEIAATGSPSETYKMPLSFQAPRSVRFMVQYDF